MRTAANKKKAFSIVEALIAAVVLSVSVMVISAITTRSLSATRRAGLYQGALDLARKQIAIIEHMGVSELLGSDMLEGEAKTEAITYNWQGQITQTDLDGLYDINIRIDWQESKRERFINLQTRLYDEGTQENVETLSR